MNSTVLIVDDIPSNLNFISDVLYNEGFGIMVAKNGKDAIDITRDKHPDLILLDIAMPLLDGYEVCKIIKSDPSTSDIPIIFLTAKVDFEDIIEGFNAGAVDFVPKPFNSTELISRVNTHIELRKKTLELKQINLLLEKKVNERTVQLEESNRNLKKANKDLSLAYEELTKLDKAKNEFIRHINHELRTPLQGILGFVRLLNDMAKSPDEQDFLNSIKLLTNRLVKLSELSLLFTELKTDNYKLELLTVRISDCIKIALENLEANDKEILIDTSNTDNNLTIIGDKKLICACFNIILDNAVKFSPEKSHIQINTFSKNNDTYIEIIDNGPGFSEKAREQLFELFSADNLNYQFYGFGIGLATAKIILDLFSAKMEVINQPDGGAKVVLTFNNEPIT